MDKGYNFLFWAYNVVWLSIVAYVAFLMVRLGKLRERLERIERKLASTTPAEAGNQKSNGS